MPERIRKTQVRLPIVESGWLFVKTATDQAKTRITTVRMAVARLELTFSTPTFARTAVRPAKNADSTAQMNQFISFASLRTLRKPPSFQIPGTNGRTASPFALALM